ncbi:SEC-C metal-binding domain-containing protein [Cohnella hashimotonis]|uniref:SEC-C metal-binding domain-containing protein n=1 Tax=Cohnella hashimotonis TaxID=2826895 RepID=A0ABT6T9D5_9BACL|nr:SEC-C metal-binding domain-containing protein [Cohnella hashimotonis]MDI4643432.1 SEC-C metal-binding domain-containing protein [Cohnella hashimotonis]
MGKGKGFHPDLITLMTGMKPLTGKTPTVTMLPGSAKKLVVKHLNRIKPFYKPNKQRLRCGHCGYVGNYDLGLIVLDVGGWKKAAEDAAKSGSDPQQNMRSLLDHSQFTGYFRCVECNAAGAWEFTTAFFGIELMGYVLRAKFEKEDLDSGYMIGRIQLHNGMSPQWATQGEEGFLKQLRKEPDNSLLWNKLGNLYIKGGRPDLAAAVFEYSISIDQAQVESHYSLGSLLFDIEEWELAAKHLRQSLAYARFYTKLDSLRLRELLANGLSMLFDMNRGLQNKVSFLPTEEELAATRESNETASPQSPALQSYEFALRSGDVESFLPVAEFYMGGRLDEMPDHERLLNKFVSEPLPIDGEQTAMTEKKAYPEKGWGSAHQPIVVKLNSPDRAAQVTQVCEHFTWNYILGMDYTEDLTDLKKAIREKYAPANVYEPCPCGSGAKYKFCCAQKMKNFDLHHYLRTFEATTES